MSKVATKATISYHDPMKTIPNGIYRKPDIQEFTENGVMFDDGSQEDFSVVIFATGDFSHFQNLILILRNLFQICRILVLISFPKYGLWHHNRRQLHSAAIQALHQH